MTHRVRGQTSILLNCDGERLINWRVWFVYKQQFSLSATQRKPSINTYAPLHCDKGTWGNVCRFPASNEIRTVYRVQFGPGFPIFHWMLELDRQSIVLIVSLHRRFSESRKYREVSNNYSLENSKCPSHWTKDLTDEGTSRTDGLHLWNWNKTHHLNHLK